MKWSEFLSGDSDKSSKRLVFLISTAAFIIQHFLLMYIKIEIANEKLVENSQDWLGYIVMGSGCLVVTDVLKDWVNRKKEVPQTTPDAPQ